jgi:hypothetical protein
MRMPAISAIAEADGVTTCLRLIFPSMRRGVSGARRIAAVRGTRMHHPDWSVHRSGDLV